MNTFITTTTLQPSLYGLTYARASQKLQRELDEEDNDDESNIQQEHANGEIFEVLKAYLPPSVLTFLLDPNPLRFLNRTP